MASLSTAEKARERAQARRDKERAERDAEKLEVERLFVAHAEYVQVCEKRGLTPIPLGDQWQMVQEISALGQHFLPYIAQGLGTIWVRDLRHKTGRQDRPFALLNMQALGVDFR